MSVFWNVKQAPSIEVFALSAKCKADPAANKVNLTIGAYRTEEGEPFLLPVVKTVEAQMINDSNLNKEYLPITGLPALSQAALRLLLGEGNKKIVACEADGVQTLGGTGALYLAMAFMRHNTNFNTVYASAPTWGNHNGIAKYLGFENVRAYRYWHEENRCVDFEGMTADLNSAPENSIVILHACAHNPTGMDLSREQWKQVADIVASRKLFPLFDIAYQGFASGDLEADAWAVRYFCDLNIEMMVAQSFSKNFGLYNERIGNLAIICHDAETVGRVKSQMAIIVRQTVSNPPSHGCRIVANVISNPALFAEWKETVRMMATRVKNMRQELYDRLRGLGTPGSWKHIIEQIGMFSFTGLSKGQAEFLREKHHVYIMNDGRINMCGLNHKNLDYVAKAIDDAVKHA